MSIPKCFSTLLLLLFTTCVFANFLGEITAVSLSTNTELTAATYTLDMSGANDGNTGNSQVNIGQSLNILFPLGTDLSLATVAIVLPPYTSSPLNMPLVVIFQRLTDL
jgi:hypothetical protein